MTYTNTLARAVKVLTFNENSLNELANDESATGHGFLTLAITGALYGILYSMMIALIMPGMATAGIVSIITYPIMMIIAFIIGYSIYHFLAKIFGGQATGAQYFRSLSNLMFITVLSVIPVVNFLVSIYMMVMNGFVLVKVHKLSVGKAVAVVLIPVLFLLGLVIFGALMYFGMFTASAL